MMDLDKILKGKAEDFHFIGERLKEIRDELVKNDDVENKRMSKFSRKNMAERMGVDYATMQNVERGSLSVTTIKLIIYYYTLGYNPTWIISPDNEFIPKHNIGENVVYQSEVQDEFKKLESKVLDSLNEFKKKL